MKRNILVLVAITLIVVGMLTIAVKLSHKPGSVSASAGVGSIAPDFALSTPDGKTIHLSDFRGKAVVLNFWATWCGPCKIEMPWFVDLQKKYESQGLQIVGVSMDMGDATKEEIQKFAKDLSVNYPILLGQEKTADAYGGIPAMPTTLYIDRDGVVRERVIGLKGRGEIEAAMLRIISSRASTPPNQ